jgi:hypothetical protein
MDNELSKKEVKGEWDYNPKTPTLEEEAQKCLELMEAGEVKSLLSSGRSSWTRGQTESVKTDKILRNEIDLLTGDEELTLLLVQEQIIKQRKNRRIRSILDKARPVPYQMSSRGVRINIEDYDFQALPELCNKARWDLIPYHYEGVAYLKPISRGKSAEGSLSEIIPVLEGCKVKDEKMG